MVPGYISMAFLIDFGMMKLYLLPLCWQNIEEVAFHFNSPVTYQFEMVYECKTSFEFVMRKNLPIPF